jgi:hypothetical protein
MTPTIAAITARLTATLATRRLISIAHHTDTPTARQHR